MTVGFGGNWNGFDGRWSNHQLKHISRITLKTFVEGVMRALRPNTTVFTNFVAAANSNADSITVTKGIHQKEGAGVIYHIQMDHLGLKFHLDIIKIGTSKKKQKWKYSTFTYIHNTAVVKCAYDRSAMKALYLPVK